MNPEKLRKLQAQVRIGGKGTPRRKKKVVHVTAATDDKKLQSSLKKLSVNTIPGIEEVNMIKDDGTVIHFNNPKAQASLAANTFAITGHAENKQITEMLPGILSQLGPEGLNQLKRLASSVANTASGGKATIDEDDEVPDLVENFDEPSKEEAPINNPTDKEKKDVASPVSEKKEISSPVSEKKEISSPVSEKKEIISPVSEKKEISSPVSEKKEIISPVSEKKEISSPVSEKKEITSPVSENKENEPTTPAEEATPKVDSN